MNRRFKLDKLVRDKFPEILRANDVQLSYRILEPQEHQQRLKNKILEESKEVVDAGTKAELTEELADLLEVMEALAVSQT